MLWGGSVLAQATQEADYSRCYRAGGAYAAHYFTIEGASYGNYAGWGLIEFDNTAALAPAADNEILKIELVLGQTVAGFSTPGSFSILADPNNSTSADQSKTGRISGGTTYNYADLQAVAGRMETIGTYNWQPVSNGYLDSYTLWQSGQESNIVIDQIRSGGKLTLAVAEADETVACTWAGYTNYTYQKPMLALTYANSGDWGTPTAIYGWEDGHTALDVAYRVYVQNISDSAAPQGQRVLKVTHADTSDPSYVYLARINGLAHGDVVKVSIQAKSDSVDPAAISLTGLYYDAQGNSGGSAGTSMQSGTDWGQLRWSWVFDAGDTTQYDPRTDFVIEAKFQAGAVSRNAWLDDMQIWVESAQGYTITLPTGDPTDCYNYYDFNGDCLTDSYELGEFASQWLTSGLALPDPNDGTGHFYKFYKYDWQDGGTATATFPSDERAAALAAVADPLEAGDGRLAITMGSYTNDFSGSYYNQVVLADVYGLGLVEIDGSTPLQDARIYVMINWQGSGIEGTYLRLGMDHHRAGAYAGTKVLRPIYTSSDAEMATTIFSFDIGDLNAYVARDGIRIFVSPEGQPGELAGYIDSITLSVPYYKDSYGNIQDTSVIFPNNNYAGVISGVSHAVTEVDSSILAPACMARPEMDFGGDYCIVELKDFAEIATRWLLSDYAVLTTDGRDR
ncbi:MAG: hypothetical protein JXM68_04715 [Sedimentisphaerales bacterium]|nr:hypothetical protein [Sedimentisphaerales bacterium]